MVCANVKIIEGLCSFLELISKDGSIRELFTNQKSDFSRNRKLPFEKIVALILNFPKRSRKIVVLKEPSAYNVLSCVLIFSNCGINYKLNCIISTMGIKSSDGKGFGSWPLMALPIICLTNQRLQTTLVQLKIIMKMF